MIVPALLHVLAACFYPACTDQLRDYWVNEYDTDVENYRSHRIEFLEELIGETDMEKCKSDPSKLTRSYTMKPHRLGARFKTLKYVDLSGFDLDPEEGVLIVQLLFCSDQSATIYTCGKDPLSVGKEPTDLVVERLNLSGNKQLGEEFGHLVIRALMRRQGGRGLTEASYASACDSVGASVEQEHANAPPFVLTQMDLADTSVPITVQHIITGMLRRDCELLDLQQLGFPKPISTLSKFLSTVGKPPARGFRPRETMDADDYDDEGQRID